MSWVFEALQQAELDRTGRVASGQWLAATEVIRAREQDTTQGQQASDRLQTSLRIRSAIPADSRLVASTQPSSLGAEKFRFLALKLRELQPARRLKKIVVTSTVPEEGKSFVSANLALTLAREREQKVLLVDGDVRRPVLSANLGVGNHPGLREWLGRSLSLSNTIHHIEDLGLWFLPAGDAAKNPVESIQSGQLAETLDALNSSFDWIIIDSPPLLPMADASAWCRISDGVLFVTREGTTKKRELKRGIEMLDKSSIIGVVVNDCRSADRDNRYERYIRQLNDSEGKMVKVNA